MNRPTIPRILAIVLTAATLVFRPIDPDRDADLAFAAYHDAHVASYGADAISPYRDWYVRWLRARIEEFPDGHLLALVGDKVVGQLELEVPYGLETGYVNLFYVVGEARRAGIGRRLHQRAEQYFRSWEARRVELHVSPQNRAAIAFYRSVGYHFVRREGDLFLMARFLSSPADQPE